MKQLTYCQKIVLRLFREKCQYNHWCTPVEIANDKSGNDQSDEKLGHQCFLLASLVSQWNQLLALNDVCEHVLNISNNEEPQNVSDSNKEIGKK